VKQIILVIIISVMSISGFAGELHNAIRKENVNKVEIILKGQVDLRQIDETNQTVFDILNKNKERESTKEIALLIANYVLDNLSFLKVETLQSTYDLSKDLKILDSKKLYHINTYILLRDDSN
jgi:predicted transcriptional regulator